MGQRDLLPFAFQEYPVVPKLRLKLLLFELSDFFIFADDFAAPNISEYQCLNSKGVVIFPGSFSSFGNYAVIKPLINSIEFQFLF